MWLIVFRMLLPWQQLPIFINTINTYIVLFLRMLVLKVFFLFVSKKEILQTPLYIGSSIDSVYRFLSNSFSKHST